MQLNLCIIICIINYYLNSYIHVLNFLQNKIAFQLFPQCNFFPSSLCTYVYYMYMYIIHTYMYMYIYIHVYVYTHTYMYIMHSIKVLVAQSCLTLCDLMDYSPPGSAVHGILQPRVLEWVAISFSWGSSQPRDWTQVSCIAGRFFTIWATR